MKVKLKPIISYEVENERGESLGIFQRKSDWEGMVSLSAESGVIIVDFSTDWLTNVLFPADAERTVPVVKATPDLVAKVNCNPT